ncbi:MAG: xanthine dehydrogenase family protein molybdopterin-binding subunit [Alphaproteobacteria bacterium]|nr:xanthine dehydrogenase family protein molybdopterin-binding subunit [Alphaproteobacteria bacterium]
MAKFGVGQSVLRVEDQRFITGNGRYTDDIDLDGQAYGVAVRSPEAHARIKSIDIEAAKAAPGVLAVILQDDITAHGSNELPCAIPMENRDGSAGITPLRPVLCKDRVRHVGDHVAFVIAETAVQAKDAAELVNVDYETLAAVVSTANAAGTGQPLVHDDVPDNLAFDWEFGDRAGTESALASAEHVVELELINNRLISNPMEPRAVVADFQDSELTMHVCTQGGWLFLDPLAAVMGMAREKIRVLTPDVGGGFGTKAFFYPEYALAAVASRMLGRPVKWTAERSADVFVSDVMGRDHVTSARLGLDRDHKIVGMEVETTANMGAYCNMFAPFIPTGAALKVLPGVYDVKAMVYRVKGVLTNTTPVDAYRGAGRPESIYLMERLIDKAARQLGETPAALRKKNLIGAEAMPFTTTAGEVYDSGEFARVMDEAFKIADAAGFESRKAATAKSGKHRGLGMSYYIESTMGDPQEMAKLRFEDDGMVSIVVGTQSNGQGHATAYAQVLVDRLGVPFEKIQMVEGDTRELKMGGGTGGSRSLTAEGLAIRAASEMVIERGKHYASQEFETSVADIEFSREDGEFKVSGTDRKIGVLELAANSKTLSPPDDGVIGMDAEATADIPQWTFPNGCHIAEVEIDPETGVVIIERYTAVDDFGVVVNPMLVAGQVHGGVVQGIGQALYEQAVYDDTGQLVSGSLMDYCMPRADSVPSMAVSTVEVPCKNNEMGVKGCGEAGSVASPAAVINAIIDALEDLGVTEVDMPATPEAVWQIIQAKKGAVAAE